MTIEGYTPRDSAMGVIISVRGRREGPCYTPQLTRFEWGETSEVALRKVGPKPPIGRPSYITTELVAHMKEVASPSAPLAQDLREN